MTSGFGRKCGGMALLWAMAGAAMAAPDQGEHAGEQGGSGAEAPYIEHVGSSA